MSVFLSNVFNDPSSPWYYVVGVLFLLLIFGALAVYMVWSNKKKTDGANKNRTDDSKADEQPVDAKINADTAEAASDTDPQPNTTETEKE